MNQLCIVCKKKPKTERSLFCRTCFKKDVFTKIKAFRESEEFKRGYNNGLKVRERAFPLRYIDRQKPEDILWIEKIKQKYLQKE